MTLEFIAPVLEALRARLEFSLQAAGVPDEDGGEPPPVPVFKTITSEAHRLYVRVEASTMVEGDTTVGNLGVHNFTARVVHFAGGSSNVISDPEIELPRIAGLVRSAVKGWVPLNAAGGFRFRGGFFAAEEDADTASYVVRLTINVTGD